MTPSSPTTSRDMAPAPTPVGHAVTAQAPLTYGQLSTWRSLHEMPRERWSEANLDRTWKLPEDCTVAGVRAALARLAYTHESLRTTFSAEPQQFVHDDIALPVEVVERDGIGEQDAFTESRDLTRAPFALGDGVGWRARVLLSRGRPAYLCLVASHMVVDQLALEILRPQFYAVLASGPGATDALAPAPRPRELAAEQRSPARSARRRAVRAHWQQQLEAVPPTRPPAQGPGDGAGRIQAVLSSHDLQVALMTAANRHGVSQQSVLLSLVALGIVEVTGADRCAITLMSSNRFQPRWQALVSTMNQIIPIVVDAGRHSSLREHIRAVHQASLLAHRHACYDVDEVARLSAEVAASRGHQIGLDHWFNYTARVAGPTGPGTPPPRELAWTAPDRVTGPPFYVKVGGGERLHVVVRVDPRYFPADDVAALLRIVECGARLAVDDPDRHPGALLANARHR